MLKTSVTFFFVLFLLSCNNKIDQKKTITYTTIDLNKEIALTADQEEPNGNISISITTMDTCSHTSVARKINQTLSMELFGKNTEDLKEAAVLFANNYLEDYKRNYSCLYRKDLKRGIPKEWYNYYRSIKSEKPEIHANTLNYRIESNRKEGGATENLEIKTFCFNNNTGSLLHLDSLFQTGYTTHLKALICDDLLKQFKCNSKEELQKKGIGRFTDIYIPQNFLLTQKGMLFIYNPHEIAPYDQGVITCLIDYDDLKKWLRPQFQD